MRPLQVYLHQRLGSQGAHNDVAGDPRQSVRIHVLATRHLPDQAVIEAHLFDDALADTVGPAVADVADPRSLRP